MSIKRFVSALLTGALCLGVLTACGSFGQTINYYMKITLLSLLFGRERRRPAVQHHLL